MARKERFTEDVKIKSFVDMAAPSVIKFFPDYFICGNTYRCIWALREYPPTTDELAILKHIGEKDGTTLKIYTRHVSPAEEKKIISNAANKNRMKQTKEYYLEASKSNNSDAEFALARQYFREGDEEECLKYIELSAEHGNEFAKKWYEEAKAYQAKYRADAVIDSATYLFCRLASIIEDDTDKKVDGFNKTIVDSKERIRIAKKKKSLGIKMR